LATPAHAFTTFKRWLTALWPFVRSTISGRRGRLRRDLEARTRIRSPSGIDELNAIDLGGVRQWIRIRGEDRANPLLLFLHGGPGFSWLPNYRRYQLPWEHHFTVVHWEQRGSGKSYVGRRLHGTLTTERLVGDACELIASLCERFGQSRLILLGHSWGSYLGLRVAERCPERLNAYVGMGQVVDMLEGARICHRFAVESAEAARNETALRELASLEPFPDDIRGIARKQPVWRKWTRFYLAERYGFDAPDRQGRANLMDTPEYSLWDVYRYLKGTLVSQNTLTNEAYFRPSPLPERLDVPVFVLQGRFDLITPWRLARDSVTEIEAPRKAFVTFEHSGHNPNETESEAFLQYLVDEVKPDSPATAVGYSARSQESR
jgi:proline iminopeptidase